AAVCKLCGTIIFSPLAPSGYCACWFTSTPHTSSVSYVLTSLPGDQALVAARTVSSHTTSDHPKPDQQSGRSELSSQVFFSPGLSPCLSRAIETPLRRHPRHAPPGCASIPWRHTTR
ncbi:unnamed protein product, partial [Ectocarpus sp. 4 AP-2014]